MASFEVVNKIEKICKDLNLGNLPALNQLKLAAKNKSKEDFDRIATNLAAFLENSGNNVHITLI